jgi:elongation factor G
VRSGAPRWCDLGYTIEDGNTISDHDPEEIKRRYSIHSAVLPFDYSGHRITLIDCPGYLDFVGETVSALEAVDGAVIVVSGQQGVEPQTRLAWKLCEQRRIRGCSIPLDKENASWDAGQLPAGVCKSVARWPDHWRA